MGFDFDSAKSAANQAKHGIDFRMAQAIWEDPDRIEAPAKTGSDPRMLVIGRIGATLWAAVVICRHDTIRILSVRRARQKEAAQYYDGQ